MNLFILEETDLRTNIEVEMEIDLYNITTINEGKILEKVKLIGIQECFTAAAQLAIVGLGRRSIKKFYMDGKEADMKEFFDANNIIYTSTLNSDLAEDDITPRRLCRIFRHQISDYIKSSGNVSYLFRKYNPIDAKMSPYCFPGAEYFVEGEAADYLLNAYKNLDTALEESGKESGLSKRVSRVMEAKRISRRTT